MNIKDFKYKDFPLQTYDKVRYSDTDRQGHVNNAMFSAFLETGRVELLYNPDNPLHDQGGSFVIAEIKIDLLAEIVWPGIIEIGTGITKVGNSSIKIAQGLYQNDTLVAVSETVIVQIDIATKKSKTLSETTKKVLSNHIICIE